MAPPRLCLTDAICEQQLILCIKSGNRPSVDDIVEFCPREVVGLMKQCWALSPDDRPTFAGEGALRGSAIPWLLSLLLGCWWEVALGF